MGKLRHVRTRMMMMMMIVGGYLLKIRSISIYGCYQFQCALIEAPLNYCCDTVVSVFVFLFVSVFVSVFISVFVSVTNL